MPTTQEIEQTIKGLQEAGLMPPPQTVDDRPPQPPASLPEGQTIDDRPRPDPGRGRAPADMLTRMEVTDAPLQGKPGFVQSDPFNRIPRKPEPQVEYDVNANRYADRSGAYAPPKDGPAPFVAGLADTPAEGSRHLFAEPKNTQGTDFYDREGNRIRPAGPEVPAGAEPMGPPPPPGQEQPASNGMRVPSPQYVGAHFDDRNIPVKAGTRAKILGTYDEMMGAQGDLAKAQQDEAAITANMMGAEAERAKTSMAQRAQVEDQRQAMVRDQLQKLTDVTDAAASGRINPNQVWESKGTVGQIAAAIGMMLGGALAANNGGHNPAQEMLDNEIARNLDAQKANLALRQQGVTNRQNLLGHYREVFGDERKAEMAFENTAREVAIQQLQAASAKAQSPIIAANARQAIAQLQQAQAKTQAEFEKMSFVHAQMVGGAPTGAAKVDQGMLVSMPDGRTLRAPTQEEAIKLRAKVGAVANMQSNVDRAIAIRQKASFADLANPYSLVHKELSSLKAETAQLVTVYRGQGAMSKGDQEVADQALGAMDGVLENNTKVLQHSRGRFGEQLGREADALGGEHVQKGYQVTPQGRLAPDAVYSGETDKPASRELPKSFVPGKLPKITRTPPAPNGASK